MIKKLHLVPTDRDEFATTQYWNKLFPAEDVNRFGIMCPSCLKGKNSQCDGGNVRCFHCDKCGLVECEVTSPVCDED